MSPPPSLVLKGTEEALSSPHAKKVRVFAVVSAIVCELDENNTGGHGRKERQVKLRLDSIHFLSHFLAVITCTIVVHSVISPLYIIFYFACN
jgi:hypothetical protein